MNFYVIYETNKRTKQKQKCAICSSFKEAECQVKAYKEFDSLCHVFNYKYEIKVYEVIKLVKTLDY